MMTGKGFHSHRLKFYYEGSRFSWWHVEILLWTVEILLWTAEPFIRTSQGFRDGRWKFYYERSRISWWHAEILLWRFSWWQAKNFVFTSGNFIFLLLDVVSVQDFIFLVLFSVLIKGIRSYGESKIPLHNPSGGKLLLRPPASSNELLGRVLFRTLSNIYDQVFLRIWPTNLRRDCFLKNSSAAMFDWVLNTPPKGAINVKCR